MNYLGQKTKGRNDRRHNHNKYGVKVVTDGSVVYSSGAIFARNLPHTEIHNKSERRAKRKKNK